MYILSYAVNCYKNTMNQTQAFTSYELIFGHKLARPPETLYNFISKSFRDLNNRTEYFYKLTKTKTQRQKEASKIRGFT